MQQSNAEEILERADLAADRTRRDVQLVSREGDAHVPRSGLEGAYGIQWREAIHAEMRDALTLSRGARLVDHHVALQVLEFFAGPDVSAPDAMARATPAAFA